MRDAFYTVLRCVKCGQYRTPLEAFTQHSGRCPCRGSFVVAHMVLSPAAGEAQASDSVSTVSDAEIKEP